jgi:hypothetical protein
MKKAGDKKKLTTTKTEKRKRNRENSKTAELVHLETNFSLLALLILCPH